MSTSCSDNSRRGLTILELILVIAIAALLIVAAAPGVRVVRQGWKKSERRIELLQNARVAFSQIMRDMRQLRQVREVSGPSDTAGYFEFYDMDGVILRCELDTTSNYIRFGPPGALADLAGSISSMTFKCYDGANELLDPPVPATIRSVLSYKV